MEVTFGILSYKEAASINAPLPKYEESWADALERASWSYPRCSGVWRFENGIPVAFIGSDARRSWAWVAEALNEAYALGVRHGHLTTMEFRRWSSGNPAVGRPPTGATTATRRSDMTCDTADEAGKSQEDK